MRHQAAALTWQGCESSLANEVSVIYYSDFILLILVFPSFKPSFKFYMSVHLNSQYHFWTSDLPISNSLSSQLAHISSSSSFPFHLHSGSIHGSKLWWLSSKALLPWLSGQALGCWALALSSVGSKSCPIFSYLCNTVMKKLGLPMGTSVQY